VVRDKKTSPQLNSKDNESKTFFYWILVFKWFLVFVDRSSWVTILEFRFGKKEYSFEWWWCWSCWRKFEKK